MPTILLHHDENGWLKSWTSGYGQEPVAPQWTPKRGEAYRFEGLNMPKQLRLNDVAYLEVKEP